MRGGILPSRRARLLAVPLLVGPLRVGPLLAGPLFVGSLLLGPVLLAGCGGDATAVPAAERADSAGVEVVINQPLPETDGPAWRIEESPDLAIGVIEGEPEYQLYEVRGAHRFPDGRIVVANGGTHQLRFYGPDGAHLEDVGGEGDGPGEFRGIRRLDAFAADSLAVYDWRNRTLSVFDPEGGFVRSFRPSAPGDEGVPTPMLVLPDGRPLLRAANVVRPGESSSGPVRDPMTLIFGTAAGEAGDSLGTFAGPEAQILTGEGFVAIRELLFGRDLHVAAAADRIAVGNDDTYSVRLYRSDGTLERIVRLDVPNRPIGEADYARVREEVLAGIEDEGGRSRTRRMFDDMPRKETLPAFDALRIDPDGNLWVARARIPGEEQPEWFVHRPDGQLVARVRTPPDVEVLEIGRDHLLGVHTDDLDVERIVVHALDRTPGL